jgi:cytoskeletal protein CcmA (bactofilin family)
MFDAVYTRAVNPGFTTAGVYEIPFTFLTDGDIGLSLQASSLLSGDASAYNPLKTNLLIYALVADTASSRALDILIVAEDPVSTDRVRPTAELLGGQGGLYYDDLLVAANDPIRGVYGIWSVNFVDMVGTSWHTDATAAGISTDQAYLAHYAYVNEEDVFGDYLYRTPQFTRPELHVMNSDLNMASNNLIGVDNINVAGDLSVTQDVIVQGSAYVGGVTDVNGNFAVDGRVRAQGFALGNTILTDGTRLAYGVGRSELAVQNTLEIGQSMTTEQLQVQSLTTNEFNAENLVSGTISMNGGGLNVDSGAGMAVSNLINNADNPNTLQLNLQREIRGDTLVIQDNPATGGVATFDHGAGSLATIDTLTESATINTTLNAFDIENKGNVTFNNFGNCDEGCFINP